MPTNMLGVAPPSSVAASRYAGKTADQILNMMRSSGWTQEGVNAVYSMRGLANPPTLPPGLEGVAVMRNRSGAFVGPDGKRVKGLGDLTAVAGLLDTVTQQAVDPFRQRSGISNFAGGVLNAVGSYVGGPVWQGFTALADAGNNALGNNDGTSYTDGRRSTTDRAGAAIGAIAGSMNGPGSYGGAQSGAPTGNDLGVFSHGGTGGMAGVGSADPQGLGNIFNSGSIGGIGAGANNLSGSGGNMAWQDWVNLAGSLYGAYSQGQGAKNASNAQVAASQAAINENARQYDQSRQDQLPWLASGTAALGRLNDPTAFTQSPGYNFVRGEGQRGIENNFAARGGAQSGNALRALDQYNQGLASQEYNNWFNQESNLAGLGQTSAQNLGSLGQANANANSNLLTQQGNARASGIEGQTNALTGGISDFLKWYNNRKTTGG